MEISDLDELQGGKDRGRYSRLIAFHTQPPLIYSNLILDGYLRKVALFLVSMLSVCAHCVYGGSAVSSIHI